MLPCGSTDWVVAEGVLGAGANGSEEWDAEKEEEQS